MVDFLVHDATVGAVGCKMKNEFGKVQPLGLQWFPSPFTELISLLFVSTQTVQYFNNLIPYKNPEESGYIKKIYGGCFLVRKEVLDRIGYFDEQYFMYVEDVDLCKRIIDDGWKIYYLSDSTIIHYCGASSNKAGSHFSVLMKCESRGKYIKKYYGKSGFCLYKTIVFTGSNLRLLSLYVLRSFCFLFRADFKFDYNNSISKYVKMIRWSMNLEKPVVKT
jgi:hypothetical protein